MSSNATIAYKRWYRRDFKGLRDKLHEIARRFSEDVDILCKAEQRRRLTGRQRNLRPLPADIKEMIIAETRAKWLEEGQPLHDALALACRRRDERLDELAEHVEVTPDPTQWFLVRKSSTSTYSSQGYGMHMYARDALAPEKAALEARGLATRLDFHGIADGDSRWNTGAIGTYQLWTNCPDWMADAIFKTITLDSALRAYPRATNVKVYFPFIKDDQIYAAGRVV